MKQLSLPRVKMSIVSFTDFSEDEISLKSAAKGSLSAPVNMRSMNDLRRIRDLAAAKSPTGALRPGTAPFTQSQTGPGNLKQLTINTI
ncbi:MAG: hypothetical protein CMQ57_03850 [Gammaproteobacteria bacterium]|nr:hypothetical protein [Gammaproteobacteria bacterium]